jgi:DNA modification methylase
MRTSQMHLADCLEWLRAREPLSIHAVCTDPPYGLIVKRQLPAPDLRKVLIIQKLRH